MLSAAALVFLVLMPGMVGSVMRIARSFLEQSATLRIDGVLLQQLMTDTMTELGIALSLSMLLLMLAALATGWLQFGIMFNNPLKFDLSKINPLTGLKNLFSLQ